MRKDPVIKYKGKTKARKGGANPKPKKAPKKQGNSFAERADDDQKDVSSRPMTRDKDFNTNTKAGEGSFAQS